MGIKLPVIQICTKIAFLSERLSKIEFLFYFIYGVKMQTVDPIAMKHDSHLLQIYKRLFQETE